MTELEYTEHGWRMTTDTNRHHRDGHWDYRGEGIYHVTLVVAERYPLFGRLVGETPEEACIELDTFGQLVLALLRDEQRFYGEKGYALKILASQVMPDHMHIAIQVLKPLPRSIGTVIRGFKSACTSLYKRYQAANGGKYAAKGENADPACNCGKETKKERAMVSPCKKQTLRRGADASRSRRKRMSRKEGRGDGGWDTRRAKCTRQ